ncbi:MAG: toprim domain-containing protein [Ekhidna sp.]|jgi:hypothetical protein
MDFAQLFQMRAGGFIMGNKVDFSKIKEEVHLPQYAYTLGYELDKKKSTGTSWVMSQKGKDKIVISRPGDVWIYFSVYDDSDNGTIIDFIKNRTDKSLYEIGKELERWVGIPSLIPKRFSSITKRGIHDPNRIQRLFKACMPLGSHPYLRKRGIKDVDLQSERFKGRVFRDRFGNVVFPHLKKGEACGLELIDENTHLFIKGSVKTLWRSNRFLSDDTLAIAETPIDAMSYQIMHHELNSAFYAATCGGFSLKQAEIIQRLVTELSWIQRVLLIVDNDEGGDRLAKRLKQVISATSFTGTVERHSPLKRGSDWNDVLTQYGI